MKKCILCERKMNGTNNFGKGCLKNMYHIMGIYDSKSIKNELTLNENILKLCNKKNLSEEQNALLMDRFLTLNILNGVKIPTYNKYRITLQSDIDSINNKTKKEDLKSYDLISLKQAYNLYKIYEKNEEFFDKINSDYYDDWQNISFDAVRFVFSIYYLKKDYLYDAMQYGQLFILKCAVNELRKRGYNFAGQLLEHSLEVNPEDVTIKEDEYIHEIKENQFFKEKICKIIEKYGNSDNFDTGIKKEGLEFNSIENEDENIDKSSKDLFGAIHGCSIQVIGKKNKTSNWDLDIIITDKYDFTKLQKINKYLTDDWFNLAAVFGNNLAMFARSCKVVHEYYVTIKFTIKDWK